MLVFVIHQWGLWQTSTNSTNLSSVGTTGNEKHRHISSIISQKGNSNMNSHQSISRLTWHPLFRDLAVVDLLLQREVGHQPVDITRLPLTVAVDAAHGLRVMARVPGGVKHHHAVRPDQVYAQTTSPEVRSRVTPWQVTSTIIHEYDWYCVFYLVDSRKTHAEVLDGALNWFISLSLSEAVVLPSSPTRHHTTKESQNSPD